MASIEKRNRNGRSRWYVRYRDPAGVQRTKVFDPQDRRRRYLTATEAAEPVRAASRSAARRRNRGRIRQEMEGRTGSSEAEHS